MLCQLLGELGFQYQYAGQEDSTRLCFEEGIEIARRHRLTDQAVRLLKFYSTYHAERGRHAAALDLLSEGMYLAERDGEAFPQLRGLVSYVRFLANLGYWDLVERGLRRVAPLMRRVGNGGVYGFHVAMLEARLDFAAGRVEQGNQRMRQLCESLPSAARRSLLPDLFEKWSLELENADRPGEALEICRRALAHDDTAFAEGYIPPVLGRAARLAASLGRLETAELLLDSLETLRPLAPSNLIHFRADVLRARLLFLKGHERLARRRLLALYEELRTRSGADGGALASLELVEAGSLRDAMHEVMRFTPEQAYRFEMSWRSLTARPRHTLRQETHRQETAPLPGIHLVYRFTKSGLIRWTASAQGVAVDTVSLTAERCLGEIRSVLECLQSEPVGSGHLMGPESEVRLRELSRWLLPRALPRGLDRPLRLHVSPDGPLSALPFEGLLVPPDSNVPLALIADIAYVRGWGPPPNDTREVVIVSNPRVPEQVAPRYGGTVNLGQSEAEAHHALARWPHAVHLSGAHATKDSVRHRWPGASIIYLAAHHIRDPGAPILGFVPLAAPPGDSRDALLESADIRALDLSACRLTVLASCASGAPYRSAVRPGPSLGDAFIDAGAASVVGSFWDVGDLETSNFMRVFLSHWRPDEPEAVSLGAARREVMKTPEGASPRVWAAWSVLTRCAPTSHGTPIASR